MTVKRKCPICGQEYYGHPAVSRTDNITPICPHCGQREALKSIGVPENEIDRIISQSEMMATEEMKD